MSSETQTAVAIATTKRRIHEGLCTAIDAAPSERAEKLGALYAADAVFRASHPMNEVDGVAAALEQIWKPLWAAVPDLERRDALVLGGHYGGGTLIGTLGHYTGTLRMPWLGIPATDRTVHIRYGEVHELNARGQIIRSTLLWDVLDVMRQAGFWFLPPSLGIEELWTGPLLGDGLAFNTEDPAQGGRSLRTCLDMQDVLMSNSGIVERDALMTMPQVDCWHPKMMWYGPSGIGTCRGLSGFVDHHQRPFRLAFPGRAGGVEIGDAPDAPDPNVGHYVRLGDGKFAMTGGWPSVSAMHGGAGWLGLPASNKPVNMRVMDFYAVDQRNPTLIRENWVPIDIAHMLLQMGIDVMDRLPKP